MMILDNSVLFLFHKNPDMTHSYYESIEWREQQCMIFSIWALYLDHDRPMNEVCGK